MRLKRLVLVSGFALLATALLATSAWAWCTPFIDRSSYVAAEPNRAPVGTEVSVHVGNWAPGPVEVRWGTATGKVLNTGMMPSSNTEIILPVTIPSSSPGSYALVVVHGASQMAAPFVVSAPAGPSENGGPATGPTSSNLATSGPSLGLPASTPVDDTSPAAVGAASSSGAGIPQPPAETSAIPAPTTATPVPAAPTAASPALAPVIATPLAGPLAATSGGGDPELPGALVAAATADPGSAPASTGVVRTATGDDLWSGLDSSGAVPGLLNVPVSRGVADLTMAIAVAAAGLVAMGGGFTVAELRRRRVRVASSPRA